MAKYAGSNLRLFIDGVEVEGVVSIEVDLPSLGISVQIDPKIGLPPGPKVFAITWPPDVDWFLDPGSVQPKTQDGLLGKLSSPPRPLSDVAPLQLPPSLFGARTVTWDELRAVGPGFEVGTMGYDLEDDDL